MIIPYITQKQQEITLLHYRFRFLNRLQIQKFLNHKDKKTINMWLKDLTAKEYLKRIYDPDTFGENTKLAIYFTGINGIRFFKIQEHLSPAIIRKLYTENKRKEPFIERCILLGDICLNLLKEANGQVSYSFETASDYALDDSPFHFLTTELGDHAPDLVYIQETTKQKGSKKKTKTYYLVSIIDATLPVYKRRSRIKKYLELYFTNGWENNINTPFPILRFISPTKAAMIKTKRSIKKLLEQNQDPEDFHIQLTWADQIKQHGVISDIWEDVKNE